MMLKAYSFSAIFPFFLLDSLYSCSGNEAGSLPNSEPAIVSLDTLVHFTSFEKHGIAQPTDIMLHEGLFYIADYGTDSVSVLNRVGEKVRTLGRSGEGPGEFLNIRDIVAEGNDILIYDSHQYRISIYDTAGRHIQDRNFSSRGLYENVQVIDRNTILSGTNGGRDHLLEIQDLASGVVYRGKFGPG
ncbi:6-bladed beta-propeller [Balneola sp. MJW-20]|uniref:6-bladed beta-propeller n=1 Tax=Gracilimonas aurantiaca TaxID=3234185 RepID=UPI0034671E71